MDAVAINALTFDADDAVVDDATASMSALLSAHTNVP